MLLVLHGFRLEIIRDDMKMEMSHGRNRMETNIISTGFPIRFVFPTRENMMSLSL